MKFKAQLVRSSMRTVYAEGEIEATSRAEADCLLRDHSYASLRETSSREAPVSFNLQLTELTEAPDEV